VNPWTGSAYSQKYHAILAKRVTLPVHQFLDDLLGKVAANQVWTALTRYTHLCNNRSIDNS
jgi:hypothetical protein